MPQAIPASQQPLEASEESAGMDVQLPDNNNTVELLKQ